MKFGYEDEMNKWLEIVCRFQTDLNHNHLDLTSPFYSIYLKNIFHYYFLPVAIYEGLMTRYIRPLDLKDGTIGKILAVPLIH